ncbi:uncharacterized protein At4g15970-like isoform X2 [Sorghum bicolor]|uniref:Nucleotide-diphospho-sugar transferase domain-containing protein n=1 Tax=Sorghum bicolor TaxID=4558 RepID=A0A1B6QAH8_SORBI|nr:uncharacterized protein At4g15970-like isoform X2 [Sorghum bicolor]KXG34932.1 hypothetical protein SORBI_3002G110600 [Sorghum bicolor]|eukprot:XP_021309676.1 uncharacterized protein At4g15970-like isoform X2 [Sorghum bicolor]
MMTRQQPQHQAGGLLLRSLGLGAGGGAGGGARRAGAMKSATSLLLGAALATAFFLLYTSLCRDLVGAAAPSRSSATPAPRWEEQETNTTAAGVAPHQQEGTKHVAASSGDADGDDDGAAATTEEKKGQSEKQQPRFVMPATSAQLQQKKKKSSPPPSQDLADLLRRAATADKTVLMTAINEAWAAPGSFLDLFLESFRHGEDTSHLPRHLVIVAMDAKALARCTAVHPFCYWFRAGDGKDFAAEQKYMKGDYLEMMWRRNALQQAVLELGYSFLFTDVDILWFRPPFPRLPRGAQVVMSSDFFVGDVDSPHNYPNGGLLYVRSSPATVGFYRHWQASRARFPGHHEQYVFDKIVKEGSYAAAAPGARVQFLDTAVFGGFCQHGDDLGKVATMHANCCVGLENKLFDLKNVLQDWKTYRARARAGNAQGFSWRVPGRCIH